MLMFPVGIVVPIVLAWGAAYLRFGSPWWVVAGAGGLLVCGVLVIWLSTFAEKSVGLRALGLFGCGVAIGCAVTAVLAFVHGDAGYGAAFLATAVAGFVVQFAVGTFIEQASQPRARMSRVG